MEDPIAFQILSGTTLIGILVFIVLLAREPWRRSEFGRSLMAMSVGILLFASLTMLRIVFGPDYAAREWVRTIAYVFILYAVVTRTRTLWRLQRQDHNPQSEGSPRGDL